MPQVTKARPPPLLLYSSHNLSYRNSRRMLRRSLWRDARHNRRRSPRISALGNSCRKRELNSKKEHQKETKIKRKRHSSSSLLVASPPPKLLSQVGNDDTHRMNESRNSGKASVIPQKLVLELILDTLQRRDTYEIFAEPVDPNEVDDYYQIIKEPMDFGTMRAKLHEGMYENLEQFKRDVFLITKNAMHFNSSATIYFRQARAIHELSKRVFHVLETDPEKFELEFLGTRRRSTRRAHNEAKDCRLSTDVKPKRSTTNVSSKDTPCSVGTSILGRNSRGNLKSSNVGSLTDRRNTCDFFSGARDGRRPNYVETDRRGTYSHQSCPLLPYNNPFGSKCFNSKAVLLGDIDYRESLLFFMKDLGPIAQMIATEKIKRLLEASLTSENAGSNSWVQVPKYEVPAARSSNTSATHRYTVSLPGCCSVLKKKADMIDSSNAEEGEEAFSQKRTSSNGAPGEETTDYNEASSLLRGRNVLSAGRRGRVVQNGKSNEFLCGLCPSNANVRDLSSSVASDNIGAKPKTLMVDGGKLEESVRPVILALEHSHANIWECKWRNKKSCAPSTWVSQGRGYATQTQVNELRNNLDSSKEGIVASSPEQNDRGQGNSTLPLAKQLSGSQKPKPAGGVSGFTFDMRFLEAQLNQMNARLGTSTDSKRPFSIGLGGYRG